ncbi:hypothetical protein GCM10022281_13580 [Sphingomonas rosea]|uniref:Protein-glutamine gamma-glutamyltransferase-like C-terminal domain-containing protein n=1 Tax=Sphingomonas rosea TaxID=335605 RepID=A0ABP7U2P4_9SPHN
MSVISAGRQGAAQPFDKAWEALKADRSVQFDLTPAPPEPKPPEWIEAFGRFVQAVMRPVGRFLRWLFDFLPDAPYARILLGALLVAGLLIIIWLIVERVRAGHWHLPWRHEAEDAPDMANAELAWLPDEQPVRSWLEEADVLARQGRFAEAVHCLLLRSVEDMARRRPDTVRPGLTSRELAGSALLPERARGLFARLARTVEASLFGGRPVAENGWIEARDAYASFALPETWRR